MEIIYYEGSEPLGHKFKNIHIKEEYGIKPNPISSENPNFNAKLEIIKQVLQNFVNV